MGKLFSKCIAVSDIKKDDLDLMYSLFTKYYSNVNYEQFTQDLLSKDYSFILYDKKNKDIQGFSTIVDLSKESDPYSVFFSGDTVVDQAYWGDGTLGIAFLKFLFIAKCKRPHKKLYWFLISKGYKTYLLMANNFRKHYPRYEKETPEKIKQLIDRYSEELYGNSYCKERGIISFSHYETQIKDSLKRDIAPITQELLKHKRISFFANKNSQWQKGDELSCLAEMTLFMPIKYQLKIIWKIMRKKIKNTMKTGTIA